MKAICIKQFGGPEVMRLETLPDPVAGPAQVVVRIRAAGVNPVETYIRSGQYSRLPELPWTPGHDGAGVVESVGAGVDWLQPGDRVYLAGSLGGSYAELALCDARQVHRLPDTTSFSQGAALGVPAATAWRALFQRGRARSGETVLVHGGSGSVGLSAIQLARAAGLRVFATAGSASGRQMITAQGAELALDHHDPKHGEAILAATAGRGVDLVVEMLANANLGQDLPLLAPGGRVAVVGSRGSVEINPRDLMAREADIRGVMLWNISPAEYDEIHAGLKQALVDNTLRPVVALELPLDQAPLAHEKVLQAETNGKIVLLP